MLGLVSETDASEQWGDSLGEMDVDLRYGRRSLRQPARQPTMFPDPACCVRGQRTRTASLGVRGQYAEKEAPRPCHLCAKSGWQAQRTAPPKVHKHLPGADTSETSSLNVAVGGVPDEQPAAQPHSA